ncbi:hypothetical protein PT015_21210 [Candidatus Mycobacterium wuenschmannii]|uniref:Uncharacterized protein n=1 Tax=Candidatus Mycobacterium wuenschmannii TaxID=3027808 RepID=A0ABY8VWM0_9MYCO|nr:hypothetical protein [Candidatus Mycobacterium wuenschmannii]WIM87336.1 hypothetical protein PT015_21210 [Candidatus Mycobacterium wuenschmannii]
MGNGGSEQLHIYIQGLMEAMAHNQPPPPIPADMPAGAVSEIDALLASLGMAGNAGDPADMTAGQAGFAKRGEKTGDAMSQFPAADQNSSQQLQQMLGTFTQMPQQFMQSFTGLFQGLQQGMNQAMQQGMQVGQQLMSSVGKAGAGAALPASALGDALGAGAGALGAGGGGAGLAGATTPAGNLGPPPIPSAGTAPASAQQVPVTSPPPSEGAGARGQMGGGMPMMPPGAAGGAAGGGDNKTDTKRVVPPSVKNGAPVQGRITTPQAAPEVVKRVAGKPIASRRILAPGDKREDDEDEGGRNRL